MFLVHANAPFFSFAGFCRTALPAGARLSTESYVTHRRPKYATLGACQNVISRGELTYEKGTQALRNSIYPLE
ncbi:hypothetical protein OBV_00320 [Oscillibacter valericigenes Sjm18-20]|nr:hypothetical protein OBV_00320 [Oscillibacter valericigenes Sjm18-20]